MSSPMAAQRQRLDGRTARPDASHGNTNRMRRYLWAAALLGAGGLLLRRDRARRALGIQRRSAPMFMSRVLYAINTRPTQALARYVAHHPRVTYLLLLAAALLAAKYSHRLRRLLRRLVHGREPATDIADAELVAYPVVDGFDEAGGEEAALHVEIAAQQEVDTTHTQGEQHLDKKTLYFLRHMSHITQSMDEEATARLLAKLDTVKYPKGTVLFRKGAASNDGMFSVVSGVLGVYAEDELAAGGAGSPLLGPSSGSRSTPQPRGAHLSSPSVGARAPNTSDTRRVGFTFDAALRAQRQRRTLLYSFGVGQTVGENALLGGDEELRVVTCEALTNVEALRFDRSMFNWFLDEFPHSIVSFILTTTARQWRVAYFTLVEFLQLPGAWETSTQQSLPVVDAAGLEDIAAVLSDESIIQLGSGECLYTAGEEPEHVYVLLEGRAESIASRDMLMQSNEMSPGCIVGGVSCFVQLPYLETVQCTQPCRFARFPRATFLAFANGVKQEAPLEGFNAVLLDVAVALAKCMTRLLRLFLEIGCQRLFLNAGDMLYNEGDAADGMYIIISGRLRNLVGDERRKRRARRRRRQVRAAAAAGRPVPRRMSAAARDTSGDTDNSSSESDSDEDATRAPVVSLELGRGETVGELSVLSPGSKRECSVTVVRESELVRISAAAFDRMTRAHPPLMHLFTNRLASRYQQVTKSLSGYGRQFRRARAASSNLVTLAIVPAGANPPPLGAFATKLVQALKVEGPVLHLTSARIDESMGSGTSERLGSLFERSKVAAWISTQEEAHRFLVFEADPEPTMWTQTCIRQADCVLLVGLGTSKSDLSRVERTHMFSSTATSGGAAAGAGMGRPRPSFSVKSRIFCRKELVLLHDPSRRPRDTRKWLRIRRVGLHHHIRIPVNGDYERLVRHLVGKARGVVLGGGGARGLAHLGVLATMEEQGVPIDYIGGTSQGAFMAGLYALTLDVQQCFPLSDILANKIGSISSLLTDLTLPVVSYFSGEAFNEAIQDVFRDTQIEDLWINYFCVTTNVTQHSMGVHEAGCLWRHCRASMTVNGLLPPMVMDGDVVVDGGYVNNLPVDTMFDLFKPEVVVAVDVEDKDNSAFTGVEDFGDSLSGWWLLWKKVLSTLRLAPPVKVPMSFEISLGLAYISHSMVLARLLKNGKHDDSIIYMRPKVEGYGLLDYDKSDEIVQLGVDVARQRIREWRRHRQRRSFLRSSGQLASRGSMAHSVSMLDLHVRPISEDADDVGLGVPYLSGLDGVGVSASGGSRGAKVGLSSSFASLRTRRRSPRAARSPASTGSGAGRGAGAGAGSSASGTRSGNPGSAAAAAHSPLMLPRDDSPILQEVYGNSDMGKVLATPRDP